MGSRLPLIAPWAVPPDTRPHGPFMRHHDGHRGGIMEDQGIRDGRFGWRGWLGVLVGLATVGAFLAVLAAIGWLVRSPSPAHPTPTPSHLSNDGYAYWYCWDVGDPHPHHLGAYVSGDHLCTDTELRQATQTP